MLPAKEVTYPSEPDQKSASMYGTLCPKAFNFHCCYCCKYFFASQG